MLYSIRNTKGEVLFETNDIKEAHKFQEIHTNTILHYSKEAIILYTQTHEPIQFTDSVDKWPLDYLIERALNYLNKLSKLPRYIKDELNKREIDVITKEYLEDLLKDSEI